MNHSLPTQVEEISLKSLLLTLMRHRYMIIATVVVAGIIGHIAARYQTYYYTAEAVMQFNIRDQKLLNLDALSAALPPDEAALRTELDIIESRRLMQRVAEKLKLYTKPEFAPAGSNPDDETHRTVTVDSLLYNLRVEHIPNTYTVRVSYKSEDPAVAAEITNNLVDAYLDYHKETQQGNNAETSGWLNERITELREKVKVSEQAVQEFKEKHDLIRLTGGQTVADKQLVEINNQLVTAQAVRAQAQARLAQVKSMTSRGTSFQSLESIPEVLSSPLIQELKVKVTDIQRTRSDLATRYGPKHPQMLKVDSELQDIQSRIQAEMVKVVQGLEYELEIARTKERTLQESLDKVEGKMALGTRAEVQLAELTREMETNTKLYQEFLSRYKATSQDVETGQQNAKVISYAETPVVPSGPNRKLLLIGSVMLGLVASVSLAFLLDYLDKGFRNVTQMEAVTRSPVLGMYPDVRSTKPLSDYVVDNPTSIFAESLRTIMTGVRFANPDEYPKVLMVTSSIPKEGKSFFALSLARLNARAGSKVLLIDCDLRLPTLQHTMPNLASIPLETVVMDGVPLEKAVAVDEISGMHLLFNSGKTPHSQELLGSKKMQALLAYAKQRYDLVVLDSPPLMALSDALVLAQYADATLLLTRWESTPRDVTLSSLKQLRSTNTRLAGLVLSRVDIKKFERFHYNDTGMSYRKFGQYYTNPV